MKNKIEMKDFESVRDNMTANEAASVLEEIQRGWFPYNLPSWTNKITEADLENYKICCAIRYAINCLK